MSRCLRSVLILTLGVLIATSAFAQLSGNKTIGGTTPDYPTIKAAFLAVSAQGVAAPGVTFLIRSGTYTEDSLVIRTSTTSASAPIAIKPAAGATVVINVTPPATTYDFAVKIDSTKYVTFDGSNNGTTSRDLTVNATGALGRRGLWFSGNCSNAVVKNCIVTAGRDTANQSSSYRGIDFLYLSGTGNDADNILVENNLIRYAYTGIRLEGVIGGDVMESPVVRNNIVDSAANAGIYTLYHNSALIYNNDISIARGSAATMYGIYVGSATYNARVYNNRVHDMNQLNTTTSTTNGIYITTSTSTLYPYGQHKVYNNFVWGLNVPATGTGAVYGMYNVTTNVAGADTFAFNSVRLSGSGGGLRNSYGFYKGSATGPAVVVNNIFHNLRTDSTAIAGAIGKTSAATVLTSNNNNLYVTSGADTVHVVGAIGTVRYKTLADWQTANTSDAASFNENTPFVSATDLHIQTTVPTRLESGGVSVAGITTDIDGQTRNASTPDIGADEGTFTPVTSGGLLGNYNVGAGRTYTTISAAVADLVTRGVVGAVNFLLTDATYSDSAQIITGFAGQGPANLVTFKPATGVTPRITFTGGSTATNAYGVRMDSVSGVVWDGSNAGGTDRSMTIECDTNTTTGRTPFFVRKGSRNVTLKNMIIKGNRHSAGTIPSVVVIDNTGFASSGGQHNMTVTNCQLMRGNNGLFVSAASGAVRDSNHTFTNNLIGGGSSASLFDHLAAAGITMTGNHNVLVDRNDINGIKVAGSPTGIRVNGANTAVTVSRNRIHNLVNLSGATRPLCFLVGNIIAVGPAVRTRAVFANNMIYDIHNLGTGAAGRAVDGIIYNPTGLPNSANGNGSTVGWFDNTWHLDMAAGEGVGNTGFLFDANFAGSNTTVGQSDSIAFYNNIASIKRADTAATRMWLLFGEGAAGNLALLSNNNAYYYVNSPAGIPFAQIPSPWPGGTTGVFVNSLTEFRDSTRLDSASRFGNPQFVSATDAHISASLATPVESGGRIIPGITADIDGDIRFGSPGYVGTGTAPDVGADEGEFIRLSTSHDIGVASLTRLTVSDAPTASPAAPAGNEFLAQSPTLLERGEPFMDAREQAVTHGVFDAAPAPARTPAIRATPRPAAATQSYAGPDFAERSEAIDLPANAEITFDALADTARFRAIVQNFGATPETTYQVRFTVDGNTISTLNNTRILAGGGRDTFNVAWNAATPGAHVARVFTLLATDPNHSNDTASANFTIIAPGGNTGFWTSLAASPNAVSRSCAAYVKIADTGYVYQFGGGAGAQLNAVARYNTRTNTWTNTGFAPIPGLGVSAGAAVAIRDSNIYLFGHQGSVNVGNTYRYNVYTNTWTTLAPMTKGITDAAVVKWRDSLIYVIGGGAGTFGANTTDTTQVYNIRTNSYSLGTFYPLKVGMAGFGIFKDTIIVAGGWNGAAAVSNAYKGIINPSNPLQITWTPIAAYPNGGVTRMASANVSKGGGAGVLFAGGAIGGATLTAKAYLWNYCTASWSPLDTFATPRSNMKAAGAGDSVVYVIAGFTTVGVGTSDKFTFTSIEGSCNVPGPTLGWTARTSGTTSYLESVKQVNASVIWAAGDGATVRKSVDGGATWTNASSATITGDIYNIEARDANNAWCTTSPGSTFIYRTTDGGATWTQVFTAVTPAFINAIKMYDANNGIATGDPVGGKFMILKTTDGGTTWARIATEPTPATGETGGLNNSLATVGTNNIWFGTNNGGMHRSTDGGATWTRTATTFTSNCLEVHFNDANYGVAGSSSTGNAASRTTNGGTTWVATTVPGTGSLNGLSGAGTDFFASKATIVYRSTDRGATWASSYAGGIGTLTHLDFFASGGNFYGTTISTTGGIATALLATTGVDDKTSDVPTEFNLAQNYPNPFNPSTTIRYALPDQAHVNLSIYNMLGQRIAELTNEVQNAGFYNVVWNGRNAAGSQVASGVYFYRIEATSGSNAPFIGMKKMLLLK